MEMSWMSKPSKPGTVSKLVDSIVLNAQVLSVDGKMDTSALNLNLSMPEEWEMSLLESPTR